MYLQEALKKQDLSIYRLAKLSEIPYATLNDIFNNKASLEKCSAETVYKLARALHVPMEDLIAPLVIKRSSFETFKSNICHHLKDLGDIPFIISILKDDDIRYYYKLKWYPECLYLLAMLDYVSRINNIPIASKYDDLRKAKLSKTVYPAGILVQYAVTKDDAVLKEAEANSIPEFSRFNIIENEVRNVI